MWVPYSCSCRLLPFLSSNSARTFTINGMMYHTLLEFLLPLLFSKMSECILHSLFITALMEEILSFHAWVSPAMVEFHGNAKNNSSCLARKIAISFFIGQSMASLCISDFFFFMYLHTGQVLIKSILKPFLIFSWERGLSSLSLLANLILWKKLRIFLSSCVLFVTLMRTSCLACWIIENSCNLIGQCNINFSQLLKQCSGVVLLEQSQALQK